MGKFYWWGASIALTLAKPHRPRVCGESGMELRCNAATRNKDVRLRGCVTGEGLDQPLDRILWSYFSSFCIDLGKYVRIRDELHTLHPQIKCIMRAVTARPEHAMITAEHNRTCPWPSLSAHSRRLRGPPRGYSFTHHRPSASIPPLTYTYGESLTSPLLQRP